MAEEKEYDIEIGAFERAGNRMSSIRALMETAVNTEKATSGRDNLSARDRFLHFLDGVCATLKEQGKMTDADIDNIASKLNSIDNLGYKNPAGVAIGYIASHGGRELEKRRVIDTIQEYDKFDEGLKAPDIIRYARLWTTL